MTPERFRDALEQLHWSCRDVADLLQGDDRNVRRWASGRLPVPPPVAEWLERLVRLLDENPPPEKWRRRALETVRVE